jgi:hypothetical protein
MTIIVFFLLDSCGAILEETRIVGKWKLTGAEFYAKESSVDALKIYTGVAKDNPDSSHPIIYAFFCGDKDTYVIDFYQDKTLKIIRKSEPEYVLVDITDGRWSMDSYENSLTIKIKSNSTGYGFWQESFKFTNSWPMKNYETLELTLKASDTGRNNFKIDLKNKTIQAESMKATFTKQ